MMRPSAEGRASGLDLRMSCLLLKRVEKDPLLPTGGRVSLGSRTMKKSSPSRRTGPAERGSSKPLRGFGSERLGLSEDRPSFAFERPDRVLDSRFEPPKGVFQSGLSGLSHPPSSNSPCVFRRSFFMLPRTDVGRPPRRPYGKDRL